MFSARSIGFFHFCKKRISAFSLPCLCVILNINELAISIRPRNFDITFIIFIFAAALIPKHSPFIQAFCSMAANIPFCRGKPSVCRRIRCCPLSRGEKCRARVHTRGKIMAILPRRQGNRHNMKKIKNRKIKDALHGRVAASSARHHH